MGKNVINVVNYLFLCINEKMKYRHRITSQIDMLKRLSIHTMMQTVFFVLLLLLHYPQAEGNNALLIQTQAFIVQYVLNPLRLTLSLI